MRRGFLVAVNWLNNPMHLVFVCLGSLLVVGIGFLDFTISWLDVTVTVVTAVATEIFFTWLMGRKLDRIPFSAIIAAFGISIFLRATNPSYFALAAFIAIASKYIIRSNGRHLLNPSNIGVLVVVFTFNTYTTIEFTQWGDQWSVFLVTSAAILFVAWRSGVLPTTISFLVSYTIFLVALVPFFPDTLSAHHYGLLAPSLMLFASFMVTDPRTSPSASVVMRVLHGVNVAALFFVLELLGVRYGLFVASLLVTALTFLSGLLFVRTEPLIPSIFRVKNLYATVLIIVSFVFVSYAETESTRRAFPTFSISPQYLLLGVASGQLLSCNTAESTFRVAPHLNQIVADTYSYNQSAAWGDYDGDGDDDLFLSFLNRASQLYRNDGGTFVDVTELVGLGGVSPSSAYFADYDNDNDADLFLAGPIAARTSRGDTSSGATLKMLIHDNNESEALRVYENRGNFFVNVTKELGLSGERMSTFAASAGMSLADFDNDGDLDVVLSVKNASFALASFDREAALTKSIFDPYFSTATTYTCNPEDVRFVLSAYQETGDITESDIDAYIEDNGCIMRTDEIPLLSDETAPELELNKKKPLRVVVNESGNMHLYENTANGFVRHTVLDNALRPRLPSVAAVRSGNGLAYNNVSGQYYQPVSFDYNNDGLMDIFIAVDYGANALLENTGSLNFIDVTLEKGLSWNGSGMGVAVNDFNNDSRFDIAVTNERQDFLFTQNADHTYRLEMLPLTRLGVGWGVLGLDYDLDGWEDLFITNGDVARTLDIPVGNIGRPLFRADVLLHNNNGKLVTANWHDMCTGFQSGKGASMADYDLDGDPDLLVSNVSIGQTTETYPVLYENTRKDKNYLAIRLQGVESNTDAVGARIVVIDSLGNRQSRLVTIGSSFYSQSTLTQLFGFGDNAGPVDVEVVWPSGNDQKLDDISINQTLSITESSTGNRIKSGK